MWEIIVSVASCGRSRSVRKTEATEGSGTMLCVSLQQKHWSRGKRETHPRDICVGQNALKINAWHRCQWVIQYWTAQAIGTSSADRIWPQSVLPAQEGAFLAHKREERKITSPKSSKERAPRLPCTKARRANRWQFTLVVQPDASNLSKIWLHNSSWRQLPWGKSDSWYHVLKLPWPAQYGWKKGRCRETRAAQKLFLEDVSAYEAEAIKNLEAELLILSVFFSSTTCTTNNNAFNTTLITLTEPLAIPAMSWPFSLPSHP